MKILGYVLLTSLILLQMCSVGSCSEVPQETATLIFTDTIPSPGDAAVTGLAWGDGSLWGVSGNRVFRMDTSSREVIFSFDCAIPDVYHSTGLAYSSRHDMVLLGLWDGGNNGFVYKYGPDGRLMGSAAMCGG